MKTLRLLIAVGLAMVCAFGALADENAVPDAHERQVSRLILKCDVEKVDPAAVKEVLAQVAAVKQVDVQPHAQGLEVWLGRDAKNEVKKRDIEKALKGTDTKLHELTDRWVGTDNLLLPVPLTRDQIDKLSSEDFYTTSRTLLYRITRTRNGKSEVSGYERWVFDDFRSKQDNQVNYHSRRISLDAGRKLVRIETMGNMGVMSTNSNKTEEVVTELGKFDCAKHSFSKLVNEFDEDGTMRTSKQPATKWMLTCWNFHIKESVTETGKDGVVTTVVTELIEVG